MSSILQTVPNWLSEAEGPWEPRPQLGGPRAHFILSHQGTQFSSNFLVGLLSGIFSFPLCLSFPTENDLLGSDLLWPAGSISTWLPGRLCWTQRPGRGGWPGLGILPTDPIPRLGQEQGNAEGVSQATKELGFSHRGNNAWQRWPRAQPCLAGLGASTCEVASDEKSHTGSQVLAPRSRRAWRQVGCGLY